VARTRVLCYNLTMESPPALDYQALLEFRTALRRFNHWSEQKAKQVGLTHAQHQLLLAVKGHPGNQAPTIGDVADYLLLRHHSAVELVNRAQAGSLIERQRDPNDGRIVRLRLTSKGEDCIEQLTALHVAELHQLAPLLQHVIDGRSTFDHGPLG
jgi:DNA-binding MarR family transcriptional regulator